MMLQRASSRQFCATCSRHLLSLFLGETRPVSIRQTSQARRLVATPTPARKLHTSRILRQNDSPANGTEEGHNIRSEAPVDQERESKARRARQLYGENLPLDHLSVEEYQIYKRLYGPPLAFTQPDDHVTANVVDEEFVEVNEEDDSLVQEQRTLLRETEDGNLEEVEYSDPITPDDFIPAPGEKYDHEVYDEESVFLTNLEAAGESQALETQDVWMLKDLQAAKSLAQQEISDIKDAREAPNSTVDSEQELYDSEEYEDYEEPVERTHPYTQAGRFTTFPRSVSLPAVEMIEPIQQHLADHANYKHLIEGAQKTFGGRALPDSNSTPPSKGRHLEQKPIPLSASQSSMSQLEANVFLSTVMPGAYATAMSVLVEVRKRLGSSWLEGLLQRPGGPRILDAGGGGAGILAWREVLKAEHDRLHEQSGRISQETVNLGSSTVLAGSRELQAAISHLLDETTFVPRMPEFNRLKDFKSPSEREGPARKLYDVIIAPYSIWHIEEDYIKKNHVQNLWSLLDPEGGVLILVEKGLPRGFEAIAGAREILLSHHIKSPQTDVQFHMEDTDHKHTHMGEGMIIAPCTNHTKCPLYKIPGEMTGRRDFCAFEQRFQRPPFLHRIHGANFHNFEDISFSYLAVQRGKDLRRELGFRQDAAATQRAFNGYEHAEHAPQALTLPRIMGVPLKRNGHITMDVCTPHGTYERWTTPKSFSKRAYRDGRKSKWGDLWALGAKTRITQPVRTGYPKGEKPSKVLKALDELGPDAGHLRRIAEKNLSKPKKIKRGDKGWKARIGRQEKYSDDTRTRKSNTNVEEAM